MKQQLVSLYETLIATIFPPLTGKSNDERGIRACTFFNTVIGSSTSHSHSPISPKPFLRKSARFNDGLPVSVVNFSNQEEVKGFVSASGGTTWERLKEERYVGNANDNGDDSDTMDLTEASSSGITPQLIESIVAGRGHHTHCHAYRWENSNGEWDRLCGSSLAPRHAGRWSAAIYTLGRAFKRWAANLPWNSLVPLPEQSEETAAKAATDPTCYTVRLAYMISEIQNNARQTNRAVRLAGKAIAELQETRSHFAASLRYLLYQLANTTTVVIKATVHETRNLMEHAALSSGGRSAVFCRRKIQFIGSALFTARRDLTGVMQIAAEQSALWKSNMTEPEFAIW
ncbi:hypothetical protein B0H66DRAFT_644060, partial [Apodospora peruviana]